MAGDDDDGRFRRAAKFAHDVEPVLVGKLHVKDHQVDGPFVKDARHGPAVGDGADPEVLALEVAGEHGAHVGVVIDDKDMLSRRSRLYRAFCLFFEARVPFGWHVAPSASMEPMAWSLLL